MVNFLCSWAIFQIGNWPNIEQTIYPSGHTERYVSSMKHLCFHAKWPTTCKSNKALKRKLVSVPFSCSIDGSIVPIRQLRDQRLNRVLPSRGADHILGTRSAWIIVTVVIKGAEGSTIELTKRILQPI